MTRPISATGTRSAAEPRRSRAAGFTLLELILAIALIGLAVGLVTLSVGGFGAPRPLDQARDLAGRITLAHEESVFDGRVLGLRWRDDPDRDGDATLEFVVLTRAEGAASSTWEAPDPRDALLAPTLLGDRFRARLEVEGVAVSGEAATPAVLLLPDGELTPFTLTLEALEGQAAGARLVGTADGLLALEPLEP